jgi:predicted phage terminase large subunit-like protein
MRKKLIEKKANGNATIELLNQHISGVIPFDPMSNSKETRFKLVAPYFESGNVWLPDEKCDKDSEEIVSQLLKFPNATHDEYVDITTQYLLDYSYKHDGGRILTDSYYSVVSNSFRGVKI